MLVALPSFANVNVKFSHDIELLAINGSEDIGDSWFASVKEAELKNGHNQLLVRIAKLIPQAGEWEKFNSKPVIVEFMANNAEITISPKIKIDSKQKADVFNQSPSFELLSVDGITIESSVLILPGKVSTLIGYEKPLLEFNEKRMNRDNIGQDRILNEIKSKYILLNESDRKSFLQWAISQ